MISLKIIPCKEMFYIRKEGYLYRIIPSLGYDFSKIINNTTKEILDKIDGRNSLNEILYYFIQKYSDIGATEIKEDFIKTILNLDAAKIIYLKIKDGEDIHMDDNAIYLDNDNSLQIKKFDELDLRELIKYLKKDDNMVIVNDNIENEYNELSIRNAFFTYKEEFYGILVNYEIKGIISFKRKMTRFGNFYINGIFSYNKTLSDFELKTLFTKASEDLYKDIQYNCKKIRVNFLETKNSKVARLLNDIGYSNILKSDINVVGEFQEYIFDYVDEYN